MDYKPGRNACSPRQLLLDEGRQRLPSPLPFGLKATPLEAVAPVYLQGFFPRSRYSGFRYYAGRKTREV